MVEPVIDQHDDAAITAQLGRAPRSVHEIAHRCPCGKPDVVATEPRLEDGTPFPTTFYLTCPRAASLIGTLEASGLMKEMTDRLADAMAAAIAEPADGPPAHVARVQAVALAWVFQTITDEVGRRGVAGQDLSQIAVELRPIVEDLIDSLDRWLDQSP